MGLTKVRFFDSIENQIDLVIIKFKYMSKQGLIKGLISGIAVIAMFLLVAPKALGETVSQSQSSQSSQSQQQSQTSTSTASATSSASASASAEVKVEVDTDDDDDNDKKDHKKDKKDKKNKKRVPATGSETVTLIAVAILAFLLTLVGIKKYSAQVK